MKFRWARTNKQTEPTFGPCFVKLYQEGKCVSRLSRWETSNSACTNSKLLTTQKHRLHAPSESWRWLRLSWEGVMIWNAH